MSRKHRILAGAVLVLLAGVLVAWNEIENAAARAELEAACACARESVRDTLVESGPVLAELFKGDEPTLRAFLTAEVDGLCEELRGELAPWRWNLGRTFAPDAQPDRAAEVRAALDRARPRCPAVFPVGAGREEEICQSLFEGLEPRDAPAEPIAVWAWPGSIRSSMCLESGRGRNPPRNGPP